MESKDWIIRVVKKLGGTGLSSLKKDEAISKYISIVSSNAKSIWQRLDDTGRLLISEMIYDRFCYYERLRFASKYDKIPIFQQKGSSHYPETTLLGCLFFSNNNVFPIELHDAFRPFAEKPNEYKLSEIKKLPLNVMKRNSAFDAIKELQEILQLIEKTPLKVSSKTFIPSVSTISAINKIFVNGDYYQGVEVPYDKIGDIRAVGWVLLLQAGKLVKRTNNTISLSPKGKKALTQPPEDVLKSLWHDWLNNKILDEFRRIHNVKGQTSKTMKRGFTDPVTRREKIDGLLSCLPFGQWLSMDQVSRFCVIHYYDFEVILRRGLGLYIVDSQYGILDTYSNTWHILGEPYLLCILFEYAATLGMIDIGYKSPVDQRMKYYQDVWGADQLMFISRYDGLTHIRVNELGEYILGESDQFALSIPEVKINVSDDGVITVNGLFIPLDIKSILDQCSKPVSNDKWMLSRESLATALESGGKLSDLKQLFTKYHAQLPAKITSLLSSVEQKASKLKLKDTLFLYECDTSDLADIIIREKSASYAMRAGARLIAIPQKKKEDFKKVLAKKQIII